MTDQTQRLEIATVRAEIGSNITYRFNNDAIGAGGIPTDSGDIKNLKLIIKEIEDKASVSTSIYPTVETGLDATAEGGMFLVASTEDDEIYVVWRKVSGAAVDTGKRNLSSQAVEDAADFAKLSADEAAASAAEAESAAASLNDLKAALPYYTSLLGLGNGNDDFPVLQATLNAISLAGGGELIFDTATDVLVSDTVLVKSNTTVTFTGAGFLKATQSTSLGGVLCAYSGAGGQLTTNVRFNNPRIDGNNLGYPGGLIAGENGIAGTQVVNVRVRGGHIKNCRRGTSSSMGAGGKGCQFENGVSDVVIDGVYIEDCTIGFETGGVEDLPGVNRDAPAIIYRNMQVHRCERIMTFNQQLSGTPSDPDVVSCLVDGVQAFNCGREIPAGTELDFGAIVFDRYSNARVRNVVLCNNAAYGPINSVVRGRRGNRNEFEVIFYGTSEYLTNHATTISATGTFSDNIFDITHYGTVNKYALGGPSGESLASAENMYLVKTDTITLGLIEPTWQYAGIWCEFIAENRVVKLCGPANAIGSPGGFNNTYPTASHGLAGIVKINNLTVSFGSGVQVIGSNDDIEFQRSGIKKIKITASSVGIVVPTYADNAAALAGGLIATEQYKTAAGDLRVVV
ncbi:hypothetical protein BK655_12185 [Pseudomonas brassicacearum]|uniref:hypothetical protein n=1 Tax=Pseudomonas brassicacearum TaxID=930166 RepID=UPI000F499BDB|nr:hypothetical protein [Pseudomonas brassicacearum]ROM84105.1 hypothetical protein BK655_12185 [Pseudomonas brassicacearum]